MSCSGRHTHHPSSVEVLPEGVSGHGRVISQFHAQPPLSGAPAARVAGCSHLQGVPPAPLCCQSPLGNELCFALAGWTVYGLVTLLILTVTAIVAKILLHITLK